MPPDCPRQRFIYTASFQTQNLRTLVLIFIVNGGIKREGLGMRLGLFQAQYEMRV